MRTEGGTQGDDLPLYFNSVTGGTTGNPRWDRTARPGVDVMSVLLFLSYADEDRDIAREITQWLGQRHVDVYPPPSDTVSNDVRTGDPERAISQADAFLALLSPSFLASSSCRRERELALHREQRNSVSGARPTFIQVLQVRETPYHEAGSLRDRPWFDLTSQTAKENALNQLVRDLESSSTGIATSANTATRQQLPGFRNREEELREVCDGLAKEDGEHFWLVIAPPQLGKSWFIDRISRDISARQPGRWVVRLVDVRDQPAEVRGNPEAILNVMFNSTHRHTADPDGLRKQAIDVLRTNMFHLYILDSAELLNDNTVRALRSYLSQVNRHVEDARKKEVRLTLIVASRRDKEWLGVTPRPRLELLKLTKFGIDVMYDALQELSIRMGRTFSQTELLQQAELVHRLSEGLPALLYRYLNWIYEEQWTDLKRLTEKTQFDELTKPYIEDELISVSSLLGSGSVSTSDQRFGLERALQILVRYRLFTQSHLRHHTQPGGSLHSVVGALGWSVEELWDAVSSTDLLSRPLKEPWQEIYAPIRRLLCRYWYSSQTSLADAHRDASQFVRSWADGQMGSDQSVVLVECLWHEAQVLILSRSSDMGEQFIELARDLSRTLAQSSAYTQNDLRQYAVTRMTDDDELVEAVELIGVPFNELVNAILGPDVGAS